MGQQQPQAMATTAVRDMDRRAQCLKELLQMLLPELQQFVERSLVQSKQCDDDEEICEVAATMVEVPGGDVFACLECIRDNWSDHFQDSDCDPQVLELTTNALAYQSDASKCDALLNAFQMLAGLIGASEKVQRQIQALASERVSMDSNGATMGSQEGGSSSSKSDAMDGLHHEDQDGESGWEIIVSSTKDGKRDSQTVVQRRASAGHAVAQRYVAVHELVQQAKTFFTENLEERAFETMRRAVTLWRRLTIDQAFLDELVQVAKNRIVKSKSNNADTCFVFAIRDECTSKSLREADSNSEAMAFWRQCVDAHPSVAIFKYWLALHLFDSSNFGDAMSYVDKALELEPNPQWLYLRARCLTKIPSFTLRKRVDAFQLYIARNPPDEEHVPRAYYALALLYLEQGEYVLAKRYQVFAQIAERPPIRFPSFGLVEDDFRPKKMLRVAFSAPLYLLTIKQQLECVETSEVECECCQEWMGLLSLLRHKMESCAQRHVGCLLCGMSMKPELLLSHQEQDHSPS